MRYSMQELDEMEGHEFEYAVADLLHHNGYRDVSVTQSSGDYGIDILARRKNVKYAIQCKRYKSSVGVKAVQEAGLGTDFYHCDAAAVITNSTFTKQAINLAKTTRVRLWSRDFLQDLIENYDDEYGELNIKNIRSKETKINPPTYQQKNKNSTNNNFKTKQTIENKNGIQLAKGVYLQNEKICFLGNHKRTYKQTKQERIAFLFLSWIIIILSIWAITIPEDTYLILTLPIGFCF